MLVEMAPIANNCMGDCQRIADHGLFFLLFNAQKFIPNLSNSRHLQLHLLMNMLKHLMTLWLIIVFQSCFALEKTIDPQDEDQDSIQTQSASANKTTTINTLTDLTKPILVNSITPVFSINLAGNLSTGYQWYLADYNPRLIKLVSQQYLTNQTKLVGSPSLSAWQFQLQQIAFNAPQVTRITFEYRRAWETKPAKKQSVVIISDTNTKVG